MKRSLVTSAALSCAFLASFTVLGPFASSQAQNTKAHPAAQQGPGGPTPQQPAPAPAPSNPLPQGGCVYASQNYSNGATLPSGQTCKDGNWQ